MTMPFEDEPHDCLVQHASAMLIQSGVRRRLCRARLAQEHFAAQTIQRMWRHRRVVRATPWVHAFCVHAKLLVRVLFKLTLTVVLVLGVIAYIQPTQFTRSSLRTMEAPMSKTISILADPSIVHDVQPPPTRRILSPLWNVRPTTFNRTVPTKPCLEHSKKQKYTESQVVIKSDQIDGMPMLRQYAGRCASR